MARKDLATVLKAGEKVANNAVEFNQNLSLLSKGVGEAAGFIIIEEILKLWKLILEKTPRKTGLAMNNWQVGELNEKILSITDDQTPGEIKLENAIWIFNNLPYIEQLEAGSSSQRPNGMVASSIEEMNRWYNEEAKRLGFIKT